MRLNNTTDIPDAVVREIIRSVRPPGISRFDVELRRSDSHVFAGNAYWGGSGYHRSVDPFIALRVGGPWRFPRAPDRKRHRAGYLPTPYLADRIECLIYLAAHELRHLWQARVPKGRRVWGARGQFSERDADAYAIRSLREWRKVAVASLPDAPLRHLAMVERGLART